jgi:hypothetical protein
MLILRLITLFSICLFSFGCNQHNKVEEDHVAKVPQEESNWETYSTESFSIAYPKLWELNTTGVNGTEFVVVSQRTDSFDQFSENVNLVTQVVGQTTLANYASQSERQITDEMTGSKVLYSKNVVKKGVKVHETHFKANVQGASIIFEQVYIIKNETAFILTFSAEEKAYEQMKPIANEVMNSFVLK